MRKRRGFSPVIANDSKDCGVASLANVFKHYGTTVSLEALKQYVPTDLQGTSLASLASAACEFGLKAVAGQARPDVLLQLPLPAIAHVMTSEGGHFITVFRVTRTDVYAADPSKGFVTYTQSDFKHLWTGGIVIFEGSLSAKIEAVRQPGITVRVLDLFRSDLPEVGLVVCLTLIATATAATISWLLSRIFNDLIGHWKLTQVWPLLVLFGFTFVRISAGLCARYLSSRLGSRFEAGLGSRYISRLMHAPLLFLEGRSVGDFLSRLIDITKIRRTFLGLSISLAVDCILLVLACVWLMSITIWSGIGLLLVLCIVVLIVMTAGKKLFTVYLTTRHYTSRFHADFVEKATNLRTIKALSAEQSTAEILQSSLKKAIAGVQSSEHAALRVDLLLQTISGLSLMAILTIGVHNVSIGHLTPGGLVMLLSLTSLFTASIERAAPAIAAIQEAGVSVSSLVDLIERIPHSEATTLAPKSGPPEPHGIELENVTFKYSSLFLTLDNISVTFPAGEHVCILGVSGSGKSTLACLLAGLYEPTTGSIRAINMPTDGRSSKLRQIVGVVFQEARLMSGSIRNNIAFGAGWASEEMIRVAAASAEADEFISEKPQGYEYEVGSGGFLLSTGQRQRIALAGALLRRPSILILDEATSGIDPATEKRIFNKLRASRAGLTTIVITHRVHTALQFDRCIILHEGRIVEDGVPDQLIETSPRFLQTLDIASGIELKSL
jgi:ATP-binding cassette subfamily B protein